MTISEKRQGGTVDLTAAATRGATYLFSRPFRPFSPHTPIMPVLVVFIALCYLACGGDGDAWGGSAMLGDGMFVVMVVVMARIGCCCWCLMCWSIW